MPTIDENGLPDDSQERDKKLDFLLWDRIKQFVETRSLQLKVNKLFFGDDTELESGEDGKRLFFVIFIHSSRQSII